MAIYRLSAKTISRGKGQSAVAAAAYRSGEKLYDEIDNRHKDYGKRTGVLNAEVMIPENAPKEFENRQFLWNQVEASERRKDSQLAREIQLALPKELSPEQNQELVFEFCKTEFVDRGMIADISIHDEFNNNGNHHAHVMLTTREVDEYGFGQKNRDWNQRELLHHWRESWADHINHSLERSGHDERVDHRSNYEQIVLRLSEKELEEEQVKDGFRSLTEATEKPHVSLNAHYMTLRGKNSWQVQRLKEQLEKAKDYFIAKFQNIKDRFTDDQKSGRDHDRILEDLSNANKRSEQQVGPNSIFTEGRRGPSHREFASDRDHRTESESLLADINATVREFIDDSSSLGKQQQRRQSESNLNRDSQAIERQRNLGEPERILAEIKVSVRSFGADSAETGERQQKNISDTRESSTEDDKVLQDRGNTRSPNVHTPTDDRSILVHFSAEVNDTGITKPKRGRKPRQERDSSKSRRKRDIERKQVFEFMGRNPRATIDNLQNLFPNIKDNALIRYLSAWEKEQKQQEKQKEREGDDGFGRER